jgi:hypothetical protein
VIYRPATASDILVNFECHKDAVFNKAKSHYGEDVLRAWSPGPSAERLHSAQTEIEDKDFICRVMEFETRVMGFAITIPPRNEFRALYVRSTAPKGTGTQLCKSILSEARKWPCSRLDLHSSLNAVRFYEKMGAKILEPITHQFANGVSMPAMKMRFDFE